jgi:alkyl hydroperoxide reductase subunit AhpC
MIGDPTGALTRNFDNMREDEGLADRATFVVDPQGMEPASLRLLSISPGTLRLGGKQHTAPL